VHREQNSASGLRPGGKAEVGGQRSEIRSQRTDGSGKRTEVRGQSALCGNRPQLLDAAEPILGSIIADIDRSKRFCHLEFYIWTCRLKKEIPPPTPAPASEFSDSKMVCCISKVLWLTGKSRCSARSTSMSAVSLNMPHFYNPLYPSLGLLPRLKRH